jgi:hypothetical protein
MMHFMLLDKEEQAKYKIRRGKKIMRIRAEMSEKRTKKSIPKKKKNQ